jgi:hypothetical protein
MDVYTYALYMQNIHVHLSAYHIYKAHARVCMHVSMYASMYVKKQNMTETHEHIHYEKTQKHTPTYKTKIQTHTHTHACTYKT